MRKIKVKKKEEPVLLEDNSTMSIKSIVIMLIIMGIVFVGFYFITVKVLDNQSDSNDNNHTVVSEEYQSEKILFGQMLTRKESEYYVYAYDEKSKLYELFEKYIKDYNEKDDKLMIYRIDLNAGMNKNYVSDKTIVNETLDGLSVSGITLFKIKDGKIENYYTSTSDIANALK